MHTYGDHREPHHHPITPLASPFATTSHPHTGLPALSLPKLEETTLSVAKKTKDNKTLPSGTLTPQMSRGLPPCDLCRPGD
ncbi:hypothetical protein E2C01_086196 [Portunus trituberculatus]|uniref:Uncharacterized protein n=1 Tax=Portunus trituberculatus TaxID=210409 RepID=A0A5B7JCT1_PORTR|nr:hypothetical protein [Portunus trituberculatus]